MKLEFSDFNTEKGKLFYLLYSGLEKRLQYPECEGREDKKRIIAEFEEFLGKYSIS